jgi:hypothetical protein
MIGYAIPLGVPIGRQKNSGSISGRVFDEEDPAKRGMSGVILLLDGKAAITDKKGRFTFPAVAPGEHFLTIDNASVGMDHVTTSRLPLQINVRGGHRKNVDMGIVRSASISGDAAVFGLADLSSQRGILIEHGDESSGRGVPDEEFVRLNGVPGLALLFRRGDDVIHTVTDRLGRFSLDDLRPGHWHLRVSSDGLPDYHQLERETFEVIVEPGAHVDLSIPILPRKCSIVIVDIGKVPVRLREVAPRKIDGWCVQVGAFLKHRNADRLAAQLRASGYRVALVPGKTRTGTLMQVRVGDNAAKQEAREIAADLAMRFDLPVTLERQ